MVKICTDKLTKSQYLPQSPVMKILLIDDHQLILTGTFNLLQHEYPNADIIKVKTAFDAIEKIATSLFDLIVMDLSVPEQAGMTAQIDIGINLIQHLLKQYPQQNLVVQSSYIKALVRIKHEIDEHQGGFAIADKGLSEQEMLSRVYIAVQGATHTQDIKNGLELKPEWLEVLRLAFEEGLTDKLISERMYRSERAVRAYWTKIQDVLGLYPEDCKKQGKNIRIQTEIYARQAGLID